jgi:hypothetical protein
MQRLYSNPLSLSKTHCTTSLFYIYCLFSPLQYLSYLHFVDVLACVCLSFFFLFFMLYIFLPVLLCLFYSSFFLPIVKTLATDIDSKREMVARFAGRLLAALSPWVRIQYILTSFKNQ